MIDLTLSSDEESPPKRRRVPSPQAQPYQSQATVVAAPAAVAVAPLQPAGLAAPAVSPAQHRSQGCDPDIPAPKPAPSEQPKAPLPAAKLYIPIFGGGDQVEDEAGSNGGDGDEDEEGGSGGGGGGGGDFKTGRKTGAGARKAAAADAYPDCEDGGGSSPDGAAGAAAKRKNRGGAGKRLTSEEREERERAKAADRAAKAAERVRAREEKAAQKAAEKERKAAEKDEQKRSKEAQKEAVKQQKEIGNALKATMVGRYMRLLLSNSLAASPLGAKMVELVPVVRNNAKDQTFPHEVQRDMPLAARGYRYCMWGVRLPAPAAARLQVAEGCALEASELRDPEGSGLPLHLFPALVLALSGDELLARLEADPAAPLAGLYGDVVHCHPGASLMVYVTGLEEALRRRERAKSFNRAAVEDLLFDVTVGMPAVRLQFDCPDTDWVRAATDILNLGYALSQQPRKRLEAYLEHFGSKTTMPLRAVKDVLSQQGGPEQLTLCDALSHLVAPQRAAAVAAEFPSLAAIMEALRARPDGPVRNGLLARCRIPGVAPGKYKQQYAGPAAAANVARFLQMQNGREEWKEVEE